MAVNVLNIKRVFSDADIWSYSIGFSVQHEPGEKPFPEFAVRMGVDEAVDKIQRRFPKAKQTLLLTDSASNFRIPIAVTKPYKGGRSLTKPFWWKYIRDYMLDTYNTIMVRGEEADDYMSKELIRDPKHTAVATQDKDLNNTPGVHYNDVKDIMQDITPAQAWRHFYTQLLIGDGVDNIPCLYRIGKKKAAAILQGMSDPLEMEKAVAMAYATHKKVDDPEAYMIEMGRLLHMRRVDDEMWNLQANGFRWVAPGEA
jgi:hypothetical protein